MSNDVNIEILRGLLRANPHFKALVEEEAQKAAKHYIIQITGFEGEETSLTVEHNGQESCMYAAVLVNEYGASIVDNGYRSIEEAAQAWPEAVKPSPAHLAQDGRAFAKADDSTQCLSCGELTTIKPCFFCNEPVCEKCWEEHTGEHGVITGWPK